MTPIGLIGGMSWESTAEYDRLFNELTRVASRWPALGRAVAPLPGWSLGCTEIELLLSERDTDLPLFPTTRIHVEAALDFRR